MRETGRRDGQLLKTGWLLAGWLLAVGSALAQVQPGVSRSSRADVSARSRRVARFLAGRQVSGSLTATASAKALAAAQAAHLAMSVRANDTNLGAAWTAVGPVQVQTGEFGLVTGRVTSIAVDPADATGNTVYIGTTGGGIWKSTNAAGSTAAVQFVPLTDTLPVYSASAGGSVIPSLSIGALAMANGVLLAGTGDTNDATDSYYGAGVLRSADGGATWTLTGQSNDGVSGNHSFAGLGFAGIAFSSVDATRVVAAVSQAYEGSLTNAGTASASVLGLYVSSDAGVTWQMATVLDGSQVVQSPASSITGSGNAATAVVWNPVRQRFYAALRGHGYYESSDGVTWTRMVAQPGAGLTTAACPPSGATACPIFRGALAVQPATGDLFALTVDASNKDLGLYQDVCAKSGAACASATVVWGTKLGSTTLEDGTGAIAEGDYALTLAATPLGSDTLLYVGTADLFRCSVAAGCMLRNTTNAANGCANPAGVASSQHTLAVVTGTSSPLLYVGNDGGLWRSIDGVAETGQVCSITDASHFQNLNGGLGSLAEVVSFAQASSDAGILLAGMGALGTAGTGTGASVWPQLSAGEGGTVAIDSANAANWFVSTGAGVSIAECTQGAACTAASFAATAVGATQVSNDDAAIHAPFLLDPALTTNVLLGTCRAWRGPAAGGTLWSSANAISRPFGASGATACGSTFPLVRSLGAGGTAASSASAQNAGSKVLYAGLAGTLDGGQGYGGHVFATTVADADTNTTVWTDVSAGTPVTNDLANAGAFNPGGFDVSAVTLDAHDATSRTVYATVMGFSGNGVSAPHVYRSIDAGAHWTNISSNLPNAPANALVVDPNDANTVYVALDTGVYVTNTVTNCASANCWGVMGTSLPNAPVTGLAAASVMPTGDGRLGMLRAATYGRGIWQTPLLTALAPAAAAMTLNPAAVTFGSMAVGTQSASVSVTVTNTGNANLVVSSVTTTGDFTATNTCVGGVIPQGGTCSVAVTFAPTATGARTGVLTVYGNVTGGQATATLSGSATAAASIVLTPLSLSFSATTVGATSTVQYVTISNTGGTTAALQAPVVAGDFQIAANTCGATLAPQTGCTVGVVFAPTAAGTRSGTLTVVDDAGTQVASLLGSGSSPATDTLAPGSLTFAGTTLGAVSAAQAVTLTNAGDAALTLIGASASGDFAVVNGCGTSLLGHSSCTLQVTYTPHSVGVETGVLTVTDAYRTQTVTLTGTGVAPAGVSLSPTNGLSYGAEGVGLTSAAQVVTLTNSGGSALSIAGIGVTGDFAIVAGSNTCGTTVGPGGVCTVQVVFNPTVTGNRTGQLVVTDGAAGSPHTVGLSGNGVDFALNADGPTSLTVANGQSATFQLLLTGDAQVLGNAGFTCTGRPAHASCSVSPASPALAGSTVVTVTVATGLVTAALDPPASGNRLVFACIAPVFCMAIVGKKQRRWRRGVLLGVAALGIALGGTGCAVPREVPASGTTGTGGATGVTPSGTYSIIVAGTSAGLTRQVGLSLTVQ